MENPNYESPAENWHGDDRFEAYRDNVELPENNRQRDYDREYRESKVD